MCMFIVIAEYESRAVAHPAGRAGALDGGHGGKR